MVDIEGYLLCGAMQEMLNKRWAIGHSLWILRTNQLGLCQSKTWSLVTWRRALLKLHGLVLSHCFITLCHCAFWRDVGSHHWWPSGFVCYFIYFLIFFLLPLLLLYITLWLDLYKGGKYCIWAYLSSIHYSFVVNLSQMT